MRSPVGIYSKRNKKISVTENAGPVTQKNIDAFWNKRFGKSCPYKPELFMGTTQDEKIIASRGPKLAEKIQFGYDHIESKNQYSFARSNRKKSAINSLKKAFASFNIQGNSDGLRKIEPSNTRKVDEVEILSSKEVELEDEKNKDDGKELNLPGNYTL